MEENQQNKPRKVFISVLGAGFYGECVYGKDDKIIDGQPFRSSSTRFVQQATLEYLDAKNWCADDAAYILVTKGAKQTNWNKSIVTRKKFDGSEEAYTGLEKVIEDMHLPFPTKAVDIKDGKNEEEIWDIFDTIISDERGFIQEGDELYFDLTHGFRYLPMLVLVLGNYSKFLKHTKKCSITYGNFEMREDGVAPIIDLLPLASLQDWTYAVADYLENGYAEKLEKLGTESMRPILRKRETMTEEVKLDAQNMRDLVKNIRTMALERQTCRGISVMDSKIVKSVRDNIKDIQHSFISAFTPIIKEIERSLIGFDTESNVFNTFAAAQWCYDNHQYQAATTFLLEGVITFFCRRHGFDYQNVSFRDLVTLAFNVKTPKSKVTISTARVKPECVSAFHDLLNDPILQDEVFVSRFSSFCDAVRNDYNHCGFRPSPVSSDSLLKNLNKNLSIIKEKLIDTQPIVKCSIPNPRVFFNISNHPISEWKEDQFEAAKQYGEIKEMPFPTIDPSCDQNHIDSLVNEYVNQLAELSLKDDLTVHVMGEMTFTYNLVARLKAMGIRCVASTTERHTHLDADGNKVSEFKFVQFREY